MYGRWDIAIIIQFWTYSVSKTHDVYIMIDFLVYYI